MLWDRMLPSHTVKVVITEWGNYTHKKYLDCSGF